MISQKDRNNNRIIITRKRDLGELLIIATEKGRIFNTIEVVYKDSLKNFAEKLFTFLESNGWREIERDKEKMINKDSYEEIQVNKTIFERIPRLRVVAEEGS